MSIRTFEGKTPRIHPSSYVDQDAVLIGDIEIGEECIILPGAVIRADGGTTRIGDRSNVQDNAVIHTGGIDIGEDVTIGHGAMIEARKIRPLKQDLADHLKMASSLYTTMIPRYKSGLSQ